MIELTEDYLNHCYQQYIKEQPNMDFHHFVHLQRAKDFESILKPEHYQDAILKEEELCK